MKRKAPGNRAGFTVPDRAGFTVPDRAGFTLLEVVLALGLAVMVMALVGSEVYTTLRLVDSGRTKTEKEQLARAIVNKIAEDLRATVRYQPFDANGVSAPSTTATASTDPNNPSPQPSTQTTTSSGSGSTDSSSATTS